MPNKNDLKVINPLEKERSRIYGPPDVRDKKRKKYIASLVKKHSEELIRDILSALSKMEDFIPAEGLKKANTKSATLDELLRPYDILWFYFEDIREKEDTSVEVDVRHGINLAAEGETFVFRRKKKGLEVFKRLKRWIS